MERARIRHAEEEQRRLSCPYRKLWDNLVRRVYDPTCGFGTLHPDEQV